MFFLKEEVFSLSMLSYLLTLARGTCTCDEVLSKKRNTELSEHYILSMLLLTYNTCFSKYRERKRSIDLSNVK